MTKWALQAGTGILGSTEKMVLKQKSQLSGELGRACAIPSPPFLPIRPPGFGCRAERLCMSRPPMRLSHQAKRLELRPGDYGRGKTKSRAVRICRFGIHASYLTVAKAMP